MMESNNFLFNSCWWLQLWSSSVNLSLVWFLNLLVVKVTILNLKKVKLATFSEFAWKTLTEEISNLSVK